MSTVGMFSLAAGIAVVGALLVVLVQHLVFVAQARRLAATAVAGELPPDLAPFKLARAAYLAMILFGGVGGFLLLPSGRIDAGAEVDDQMVAAFRKGVAAVNTWVDETRGHPPVHPRDVETMSVREEVTLFSLEEDRDFSLHTTMRLACMVRSDHSAADPYWIEVGQNVPALLVVEPVRVSQGDFSQVVPTGELQFKFESLLDPSVLLPATEERVAGLTLVGIPIAAIRVGEFQIELKFRHRRGSSSQESYRRFSWYAMPQDFGGQGAIQEYEAVLRFGHPVVKGSPVVVCRRGNRPRADTPLESFQNSERLAIEPQDDGYVVRARDLSEPVELHCLLRLANQ